MSVNDDGTGLCGQGFGYSGWQDDSISFLVSCCDFTLFG
jgi:hypothetical protein